MTDRELLEAAAKAAGMTVRTDVWHDDDGLFVGDGDGDLVLWNPITDDGDALRLAVKLEIDVLQRRSAPQVWAQAPMRLTVCEEVGNDRQAATRRAIVRAAAELAK